ncbi:MAG TPA: VWA-like domain-containing protein [Paracoccaceae bacterium]|nr:VWA-like domain-containing protein [Paracoccaceae bacterium]
MAEGDPALAALALWCAHRDGPGPQAARTAGDTIHYGPAFDRLPRHEAAGLAAHHILHVALRHGARMQAMAGRMGAGFDPVLWTLAADAIVNEALLLAGQALPRPALRLTGLLEAALGQIAPPRAALAEWDADKLYLRLRGAGEGASARARDHAAAQGFAPDLDPEGAGRRAGDEGDTAEDDWRAHLTRAMEAGRMAGRGIGTLAGVLADLPQPRLPWEVVLRGWLARAPLPLPAPAALRPARAWLARDAHAAAAGAPPPAFQPGSARNRPAPRLAILLDTSSSVAADLRALFLAEVESAARRSIAEVHLISFDEAPEAPRRLDPGALRAALTAPMRTGGGTDFAPALAAAGRLAPSLAVVLTDLDGPCGPKPRFPVVWAVPDPPPGPPPFGRVLEIGR